MTAETPTLVPYVRPKLYAKQEAALFHSERWGVVEASTKAGKTVGCLVWIHEQAALNGAPGRNFWWVAPINAVSKIAFRRLKRYLPRGSFDANETEQTVTLRNGAIIWFKSADKPDSLYGEDVYAAVIDEATRCKVDAWTAVRTTLTATGGPCRIIGNVKGSRNWAYRMARRAEAGAANHHYAKLTVWDAVAAGIFPAEEAESARSMLTEAEFAELYLAQAADTDDQFIHVEKLSPAEDWPRHARVCRAWDLAVTPESGTSDPDYTVGAKLAWDGREVFIVDIVERRDSPDRIVDLVTKTVGADGAVCDQLFEEEKGAAGKMMVEQFRRMLRNIEGAGRVFPAPLTGDKRARAFMLASRINEGNGRMVKGGWNQKLSDQFDEFPDGDHDDIVDACAHAYNHLVPRTHTAGRVRVPGT